MKSPLTQWLEHPLTRDLDPDAAATTAVRRVVVAGKPLLRDVYQGWYDPVAGSLPPMTGAAGTVPEPRSA